MSEFILIEEIVMCGRVVEFPHEVCSVVVVFYGRIIFVIYRIVQADADIVGEIYLRTFCIAEDVIAGGIGHVTVDRSFTSANHIKSFRIKIDIIRHTLFVWL